MQLRLHVPFQLVKNLSVCFYIFVTVFLFGWNDATMQKGGCDKSREILNSTWGMISDGPPGTNYTQDSHCEWLIKSGNKKDSITLIFHSMATECSYDYLYVYDGETFNSPLLGSFSGKTLPQYVIARSGSMLILLYSDANYVLQGFKAEYSISHCPRNCTIHGECVNNSCICEPGWGGLDCSYLTCPDECGSRFGRGICIEETCRCFFGYSGQACDLYINDSEGSRWYWLSYGDYARRAAHTAVYVKETDSLYVFGGYDLNNILANLSIYSFNTSTWESDYTYIGDFNVTKNSPLVHFMQKKWDTKPKYIFENLIHSVPDNVTGNDEVINHWIEKLRKSEDIGDKSVVDRRTQSLDKNLNSLDDKKPEGGSKAENESSKTPSPRYGHAASRCAGGFVIYGGKTSEGTLSDELWFFNVTSKKWSLRARFSITRPPKLTRHTLTAVNDNSLYLFGGSTSDGEFSSKIYAIELNAEEEKEQWKYIRPRGGKDIDVRLVAHTTVYSSKMDSLIVYGGIIAARLSRLSDRMFMFKISTRHWTEVHYPRTNVPEYPIPYERAFHSGVIMGNYLLVFGGYTHRHNEEEICYDRRIYLYHLACHTWVSVSALGPSERSLYYYKSQGVFAHAADVRNGNTLIIIGGYHGNVNGDLWAFMLPPTIASREGEVYDPEQFCSRHHTIYECVANPECGWCPADEICYGRTVGINCTTNLQTTRCPGLCPALGDCHSCLIHGEMPSSTPADSFSVAHKLRLGQCVWCAQNSRCHHKDDNYGVCGLRDDTPTPGWWGTPATEIVSLDDCKIKDHRPGLTFIRYKHPANYTHPDSVSTINSTALDFDIPAKENKLDKGIVINRMLGYIHIPNEWLNVSKTLRICTAFCNTILKIGQELSFKLEMVGNTTEEMTECRPAHWPSGSVVSLHPGRYLIDYESWKTPAAKYHHPAKIVLMHTNSNEISKRFTFEFLEPYQNGSCGSYSNCLQCLTDSSCGWCDVSQTCLPRNVTESQACRADGDWQYLTLHPSACVNCSNYVTCETCMSGDLCEWWVEDALCVRRGRGSVAVQNSSLCPSPCYLRKSCSQCLSVKGRCVWCESTKECFSFSVYTSEYQFGMCREWVDQNYTLNFQYDQTHGSEQCKSCYEHLNCSSCLQALSCGWCYEIKNPIVGLCVSGDFNEPEKGSCSGLIEKAYNKSLKLEESGWSYAECPDVDECELKVDNCHPDSVCTNTPGSFTCECKKGFVGDGRRACNKTCYNECLNGVCSMAPDYRCQCNLGWTGEDCGIDCGCNNHSTCNYRVGVCDDCQDWTTGDHCEFCKLGSYGNATTKQTCRKCECNGHEDSSRGMCDPITGVCYCKDNTEGDNCDKCKKGYYGNPQNGGLCYSQCVARGMMTEFKSQGIGSHRSTMTPWEARLEGSAPKECLWILNSSQLTNNTHSVIQLTVYGDININCHDNSVFVYEGLPDLVSLSHQTHALAAFCQRDDKSNLTVETKSGTLTVLFKQGEKTEGFNASYSIFTCPDYCPNNRSCVDDECVCREGWTGVNCTLPICLNNCSFHLKQGICDKGYGRCICKQGYGGSDCSVKMNEHQIIFTELFNSAKLSPTFDHLRKMIPRFGHSVVTDRRGSLWMFGGYSLSHGALNDIRLFDTKNNTWMQVTVDSTRDASMPQGRYFHAAEIVHSRREIFIFGGIGAKDGSLSGSRNSTLRDFWKFSIKHQRWADIVTELAPPPLAGHTLTLMKDLESENLFLIGGYNPTGGFSSVIWCFNLETDEWKTIQGKGNGPKGIYGHTSVYHATTKSFYIYGGYLFLTNQTIHSNKLYSFHYPSMSWSLLPTFEEYNPVASNLPQFRFLHSAITTKEYMLVFGGKSLQESSRSSDLLIAYSYSCNQWIRLLYRGAPVVGAPPPMTYAQSMTYDPDTRAVYVVGGFDNVIHSEVTRINLPLDLCNLWRGKEKCRSFLGCSFCSVMRPDKTLTSYCYSSSKSLKESCDYYNGTLITNNGVVCDNKWFEHRSCEHFRSCDACLAKWPAYSTEEPVCKWCTNCQRERCVSFNHTCKQDAKCEDIVDFGSCSRPVCIASDCTECNGMENCSWIKGTCVRKFHTDVIPGSCPPYCSEHKDCSSCLSNNCRWSTTLRECFPSDFQPLICAGGICGLVLRKENRDQCPEPCSKYKQCATCLKNSHCGWCSDPKNPGEGACIEGTIDKPSEDAGLMCDSLNWNYVTCPEENECTNGHHTCNPVSEVCEDLPNGFQCVCGNGYKFHRSKCEPVCSQGCVRGRCVQPDICACDFGYVGANCSIQCQCNGHSNCAGPDQLHICLDCHNNTEGTRCERCKPLFVGDPSNNGKCIPCYEYCNHHTNICVDETQVKLIANKSINEFLPLLGSGTRRNAVCIGCTNKTKGRKCDECMDGYFRGTDDLRHHCRPCECHGHGDRCDPITGEKCNCANNTESECQTSVSKNSNQQCWMLQCSKCKESYSGTPTEGHQCYKQMTLDHKFCLNSKLIDECKLKPKPLYPGQSAFFQVQPRYVNVDIRVFIDVMQGSLDLYLSPKDDSLVVFTNTSGEHILEWDPKYKKRQELSPSSFTVPSMNLILASEKNGNFNSHDSSVDSFFGLEKEAEGLTTYITVTNKNTFLHVKNIKGRVIVILPKDRFDLISTRFYLGLVASTQGESVAPTYGIIFFRQDQVHIDLFVFFSMFFSCFFLFLAACVIAWKAKQAADVRRARRRHVVEMLHMAKRPFARVVLHLETDDENDILNSSSPHRWKRSKMVVHGETRPVAIEPTEDGLAGIATFFVKLPGGSDAPVQLSLASSLITISRMYHLNSRVFLRRRSSHHGST